MTMFLCNDHHRRSFSRFCRKKRGGSGKIRDRKHTTPAVMAVEHGHESKVPSIRDDDTDMTQVGYVPETVYCLVEDDELDTVSKHDQDETKSIAKSRRDVLLHEAYEKDENKLADDTGKIETSSWINRGVYSSGSTKNERKTKRVSLDQGELDFSKYSGTSTSPTYTEGTQETASTRTSKGDNCVGATVDELGAVIFNAFPTKKLTSSPHKDGIPAVISIGHEPVVLTPYTPILGCFNPVQTAMEVGAAIELAASRTFSTKHRQLQNVRRVSRKRELRSRNHIENNGFGALDYVVKMSTVSAGPIDPLQTVMENSTELAAAQTCNFNTKHRQLQEASRSHSRQLALRGVRDSGSAKQYAVRGVDHSNVDRANTYQRGLYTRRPSVSIVPFSQCAILEATKSMSEESKDECALRNPNYVYMTGSINAQSRS